MAKRDTRIRDHLQSSRRGLLVQLAGLGDLIMALPAIENLHAHLPHVRWTLATRPQNCELLVGKVDEVQAVPWPPTLWNAGLLLRQMYRLRHERFDVAIHLYDISSVRGALGMKAMFLGIHPALSVGRVRPHGPRLFDVNWEERDASSRHEVDLNMGLIGSLGVPCVKSVPALSPQEGAVQHVRALLQRRFGEGKRLIVIFPGGTLVSKHWPVACYVELAIRFSKAGFGVCVIGGEAEWNDAQRIADAACQDGYNLAGILVVQEVIAVLSLATAYVGNDSGPTHLAAAAGTPCWALFRPCDVKRYRPLGNGFIQVVHTEAWCVACTGGGSGAHTCMETLALETVWAAVREMIPDLRPKVSR